MTTYTMPTTGFATAQFGLKSNTQTFTSPITGKVQVLEMTGHKWTATYNLPPLNASDAGQWIAFLTKLRGQTHSFFAYDPARTTAQGSPSGTPLVNGAGQTGTSLVTDGWTNSTAILKAGDYISVDATLRQLYMVVADVSSDGSGNATLTIEPPIRTSPEQNSGITVSSAACVMRLTGNQVSWNEDTARRFGITFSGEETI